MMEWLDYWFSNRLISSHCEPEWSPHLPDLNPPLPDFYLWGLFKDNNPQSIAELKVAIRFMPYGKKSTSECWQFHWMNWSVSLAQWQSFVTCPTKNASFDQETSYCIKSSFIWVLKSHHITSERSNQMTRAEIDWLYSTVH